MIFKPRNGNIVVKGLKKDSITQGGIFISKEEDKSCIAEVIFVCETIKDVRVGDRVVYSKYSGSEIKLNDGTECSIIKNDDILALVEGER